MSQARISLDCDPAAGNRRWRFVEANSLRNPSTVAAIRGLMAECGDRLLHHDPVWLFGSADHGAAGGDAGSGVACLLRSEGRLIGYAPFTRGARTLRFAVGELTLYRKRLPSLTLIHDVVLAAASEGERANLIRDLFREVADRMRQQALFFEGIAVDGVLSTVAIGLGASGWVVVPQQSYEHHLADLPPSFAEYEQQLGYVSRKSLRRDGRRLAKHVGGSVRARRFVGRDDVPEFLAAAQAVSRRTYQWKLLGLGLRDEAALTARLGFAADHGWLRCYILYCGDDAVAFMLGYLYRGVYYTIETGYDPDWASWSVGSLLQMEIIRDLLADGDRADRVDYSTGSALYKARFGNISRDEMNLVLLKRSLGNRFLAGLYAITAGIDRGAATAAATFGVKDRLKKWLRRARTR